MYPAQSEEEEEPDQDSRPSTSLGSSALSASDWRKIRKLLRDIATELITETDKAKASKLSNTLLHITTENTLLKAENEGMKQALYQEKKKRKRGKHLFEELRSQDNQGATFFSPTKIQAAKDLQVQKEEDKAVEKVAKDAKAEEKRLVTYNNKVAKQQKQIEAVEKQKQKEEEALAKAERTARAKETVQASRQLNEALQASVKKPRKQSKAVVALQQLEQQSTASPKAKDKMPASGQLSRARRKPAYLEEFELDF